MHSAAKKSKVPSSVRWDVVRRACKALPVALIAFPLGAQAPERARAVASATDTIAKANAEWLPAMQRRDAVALAAPYAVDGLFVTTRGEVIRGREAIRKFYEQRLSGSGRIVGGSIVSDGRARVGAALIYEWGHATFIENGATGATEERGGPYLTVWQLSADGHWEILRNLAL